MGNKYVRPSGINRFQIRSANLGTLPSAWLDQEFNNIIKYLNGFVDSATINASEWKIINDNFTFSATNSFTAEGNLSGLFEVLRAVRLTDDNSGEAYSHIKSSVYNEGTDTTVITLYDDIVPANIAQVALGFLSKDAESIFSVKTRIKRSNYTIQSDEQILFIDDTNAVSEMWDDNGTGETGTGYLSLLITLPTASELPNKVLCIKKTAGAKKTIISSQITANTQYTEDNELQHIYTYGFTIKGGEEDKNRIELKGIGEAVVLVSDGENWYEITPKTSENTQGIVRLAKAEEITLTPEQTAKGEELRKDLAVSPYQIDKAYLRTDARNAGFSSNYIYKAPNGVANIVDNSVVVYEGLGLNVPDGITDEGTLNNKQIELDNNIVISNAEVSEKLKLLFIKSDLNWQEVLSENYYMSYKQPTNITATLGSTIMWFDLGSNLLKQSINNGADWTTFDGAGPICEYYGNGVNVVSLTPYTSVGFLTRDNLQNILNNMDYVIETYVEDNEYGYKTWYRLYKSGWLVQGGASDTDKTVTYKKPFAYKPNITCGCVGGNDTVLTINDPTESGFRSAGRNTGGSGMRIRFWWRAEGERGDIL